MSEYLKEEGIEIRRMEDANFTEEQIDAIMHYLDFKLKYQNEWRESELSDAKIELRQDIRHHRHTSEGGVVKPF